MANNTPTPKVIEGANLRISAMFDAVIAQRNNALNEVAELAANIAVLTAANAQLSARVAELESKQPQV